MVDPELHRFAHRVQAELTPDEGVRARVSQRVRMHIEEAERSPRRRIRRLRFAGLGVALVGSVVVALVVALAPGGTGSDSGGISIPPTARAALHEAAGAAGAAQWRPLQNGAFHHTYRTSFIPKIPPRPLDDQRSIDRFFHWHAAGAEESWLDAAGHGLELRINGGSGNPDEYPIASGGGNGFGWGGSAQSAGDIVSPEASLRLADAVMVTSMPRGGAPVFSGWLRTPSGYVQKSRETGTGFVPPGETIADARQLNNWGATWSQLQRLNEAPDVERRAEVLRLLDAHAADPNRSNRQFPAGLLGTTAANAAREERIEQAVKLLGSAPLAPAAREALFTWLAEQPGARLDTDGMDAHGRAGTRVTFETEYSKEVPARSVTSRQLIAERRLTGTLRGPNRTYRIKAHRDYRRWMVTFVFDRRTGELMDHTLYSRYGSTAQTALAVSDGRGNLKVLVRPSNAGGWLGGWDSVVYMEREQTTKIQPRAAACGVTPRMCR